jgi:hypothetical protein
MPLIVVSAMTIEQKSLGIPFKGHWLEVCICHSDLVDTSLVSSLVHDVSFVACGAKIFSRHDIGTMIFSMNEFDMLRTQHSAHSES